MDREYEILSDLKHPHICNLYLFWDESTTAQLQKEKDNKLFNMPLVCFHLSRLHQQVMSKKTYKISGNVLKYFFKKFSISF